MANFIQITPFMQVAKVLSFKVGFGQQIVSIPNTQQT